MPEEDNLIIDLVDPATLQCEVCGCSQARPCPAGCAWANYDPPLCSVCAQVAVDIAEDLIEWMAQSARPERKFGEAFRALIPVALRILQQDLEDVTAERPLIEVAR